MFISFVRDAHTISTKEINGTFLKCFIFALYATPIRYWSYNFSSKNSMPCCSLYILKECTIFCGFQQCIIFWKFTRIINSVRKNGKEDWSSINKETCSLLHCRDPHNISLWFLFNDHWFKHFQNHMKSNQKVLSHLGCGDVNFGVKKDLIFQRTGKTFGRNEFGCWKMFEKIIRHIYGKCDAVLVRMINLWQQQK